MPSRAQITINDGATTPVAHVFTPIGKPSGNDYEYFVSRVNGVPLFQEELRVKLSQPTKPGQPYRISAIMIDPTTKVIDGSPGLDFQNRMDISFTLAANGTEQSRKDLRSFGKNLLSDAFVAALVDKLESVM